MDLPCQAHNFQSPIAFGFARRYSACKDISTPNMLFNRACIIAEGNSLVEPNSDLESGIAEIFDDIFPVFPILHKHHPGAPDAIQLFMTVLMGVLLDEKKVAAYEHLGLLLGAVHDSTCQLRSLPARTQIPNRDRVNLFVEILQLLSSSIPLTSFPMSLGATLSPSQFIQGDQTQHKLKNIQDFVEVILTASAPPA
ncbi:hypothetical protein DL96DRAFT_1558123 [Flagelloscypha sp. PMI_526]|nr:hypothetical protein DL96DRAFT_1558123 [Flagelloscypha sp. PMI_526]